MKKRLSYLILLILFSTVLTGCGEREYKTPSYNNTPLPTQTSYIAPTTPPPPAEPTAENLEDTHSRIVNDLINTMTLEEKVGQIFIAAFRRNSTASPLYVLDRSTKQQIQKYKPGGVILFSENIDTIPQTQKLIQDMQDISEIPLFIAVDEEGGRVSRIGKNPKMHSTRLPSSEIIGLAGDPTLAYEAGVVLGAELSSLGFNMNFAPVADVNTNPQNPVIGSRSFGSDPNWVGFMVQQITRGMQDQNVCAVLKHFPGHGDTSLDSHLGQVIINHDIERLRQIELVPFQKGINAGADGVMTAHIKLPNVISDDVPATLSGEILTGLLRDDLNHDKLIITDAMEMKAISNYWSSSDAAVMAFKAGADLILIPSSLDDAYNGIIDALQKDEITEERLDESLQRILKVKLERNILEGKKSSADPEKILGNPKHLDVVERIKEKAGI